MIETTIQELTAAIRELTVALNNSRPAAARPTPIPMEDPVVIPYSPALVAAAAVVVPKPAKAKAKAEPKPEPVPEPAPVAEPVMAEESPIRTSKVTQADLRDAASKLLAQKKLPEILRINRDHGIRRITECPEDKYESVFNALTAALADGEKS
jgi:hypothetical protein